MLVVVANTCRPRWEFIGVTVRGRVNGGDGDYETQEQGCAGWVKSDAATLSEVLGEFGK